QPAGARDAFNLYRAQNAHWSQSQSPGNDLGRPGPLRERCQGRCRSWGMASFSPFSRIASMAIPSHPFGRWLATIVLLAPLRPYELLGALNKQIYSALVDRLPKTVPGRFRPSVFRGFLGISCAKHSAQQFIFE